MSNNTQKTHTKECTNGDAICQNYRLKIHEEIIGRVSRISKEFEEAFDLIKDYTKSVSFFGSARIKEGNTNYERARRLAEKIVKELRYTIVSGGGGGIMEASNRGAYEAGGESVGLNIRLPHEQRKNKYLTESMDISYFFVRKTALSFAAETYIFFPGGFGTMDEFFEIITLIQTNKIPRVPVILVGKDFWTPLIQFLKIELAEKRGYIDEKDLNIFEIVDNDQEIIEIIKKTPVRIGIKPKK